MAFDERKAAIEEIEQLRGGRKLVSVCNFDRPETPGNLGANIQFAHDLKEPLYRVLKETLSSQQKLDVLLYTRGGDTNAVWPIACLLREFDPAFEVLIPFRCHSSGTLLALAAQKIVMTPMAELSPIDPTTGNQFNPRDEVDKNVLGISVEDVTAYVDFIKKALHLKLGAEATPEHSALLQPHLAQLTNKVHPVAIGNVHRVLSQIKVLAKLLLQKNYGDGENVDKLIASLTTQYYSHHHMISRNEAQTLLGKEHVAFAEPDLAVKLDNLLRLYEDDFALRSPFYLNRFMANDIEKEVRLIGGCVESSQWGYLYETRYQVRQFVKPPQGVQFQLQPGQVAPLIPGMPRHMECNQLSRGWVRNKQPIGVSL